MNRREFLTTLGAVGAGALSPKSWSAPDQDRPNILWISAEDICPILGCYGDDYARTPNLDALAARGTRYTNAYGHAPVCAPARSGIITGVFPTTLGSHHMRSRATLPPEIRCFTEYLRQAGYYCSNRAKQDYNFQTPKGSWDDSNNKAHWRNRPDGKPFFSVFNYGVCHESVLHRSDEQVANQTKRLTAEQRHDPDKAPVPAYHPDVQEFREDWARYYDSVTALDYTVGDLLGELENDGLADDTIVVFWGDHGTGMPRGKRWLYNSGTHIPLIVCVPEKFKHLRPAAPGSVVNRLVSFIDFAPTTLSLGGVPIPAYMQGRAFLGEQTTEEPEHLFAARDRMDNRYDCIRSVRTKRFHYIRNFNPHVPYDQYIDYLYKAKSMRKWRAMSDAGELTGPAALYMRPRKPFEELFDVTVDPDEVNDLAGSGAHRNVLEDLRRTLYDWMIETRDLGLLDEAEMHERSGERPQYELGLDAEAYDLPRILETADLSRQGSTARPKLLALLDDADSAVRFWAVVGLAIIEAKDDETLGRLAKSLEDASPSVRLAAADALGRAGRSEPTLPVLIEALKHENQYVRLRAVVALDDAGEAARPALEALKAATEDPFREIVRVATHAVKVLGG